MMQAVLLVIVAVLVALGSYVLGADVFTHGKLHLTNTVVGAGALILAVALALPTRFKEALGALIPALTAWRGAKRDV